MDRTSLIAELNSRGLRDEALTGPLYKRLAQTLTGLIQEGLLKPGTALPGERDLAEALKLGRVTVRTAYRDLMASGALESRHGSGTFVSSRVERMEQSLWRLSSFSADMRSRGRLPAARILSRAVNTPSPEESFLLGLGGDEPVLNSTACALPTACRWRLNAPWCRSSSWGTMPVARDRSTMR